MPITFAPANGLLFYEDLGWRPVEVDSVFSAAQRFGRLPLLMRLVAWLPQSDTPQAGQSFLQRHRPAHAVTVTTSER